MRKQEEGERQDKFFSLSSGTPTGNTCLPAALSSRLLDFIFFPEQALSQGRRENREATHVRRPLFINGMTTGTIMARPTSIQHSSCCQDKVGLVGRLGGATLALLAIYAQCCHHRLIVVVQQWILCHLKPLMWNLTPVKVFHV